MVILTSNQTLVFFVLLPENYIGPNLLQFADNLEKAGTTQYSFDSVTTPVLPLKSLLDCLCNHEELQRLHL